MNQIKKNNLKTVLFTVVILLVLNGIGSQFFHRFDLTKDHRYTLSPTSLKIIQDIKEPLIIDVFLKGEFPGEFKKLQTETQQLLEEFKAYNSNIVFQFVNPLENEEEKDTIMQSFMNRGLTPINVTLDDKGKQTQEVVFPWAKCESAVVKK
jgi:gliding-associated putative ABC transporter substrate-binding component GldG